MLLELEDVLSASVAVAVVIVEAFVVLVSAVGVDVASLVVVSVDSVGFVVVVVVSATAVDVKPPLEMARSLSPSPYSVDSQYPVAVP